MTGNRDRAVRRNPDPAGLSHSVLSKILRRIGLALGATIVTLILAAAGVLIVAPRLVHGTALTVLTGSMTPKLQVGSVVIDRPVDPGTLHVGDIATYQKAPGVAEYITHRIVAINTATNPVTFTFKGDANRGPDPTPVPASAIRGKVWFDVPYLGALRDSLQDGGLRAWLLVSVIVALSLYAGNQIRSTIRDRRRSQHAHDDLRTLELRFRPDALVDLDASRLARLLGGDYEVERSDDAQSSLVIMTFRADDIDLAVISLLLEPFGPSSVEGDGTVALVDALEAGSG